MSGGCTSEKNSVCNAVFARQLQLAFRRQKVRSIRTLTHAHQVAAK